MREKGVPAYYRREFESFFADIYDALFSAATLFQVGRLRKKAVDALGLEEGQSAIDLGCGTGGLTVLLAEKVGPKGRVLGVDLSRRMLKHAMRKARTLGNVSFARMNVEDAGSPSGYDAASIGFAAHELPPEARLALYRRAHDALKPGGRLLVFDYARVEAPLVSLLYRAFLRALEPHGLEYVAEDHGAVLAGIGFTRIYHRVAALAFDIAVYSKGSSAGGNV